MRPRILSAVVLAALLTACAPKSAPPPANAPVQEPAPTKEALNDKAFAQIQAKRWDEAIRLAEQAVKLDESFAPARFNLGLALYRAGRFQEAEPHLAAAYKLNPQQVEPGWFLALTYQELGRRGDLFTVLYHLKQRFPQDTDVAALLDKAESRQVKVGERVLTIFNDQQRLSMADSAGKGLWSLTLKEPAGAVVAEPSGARVLAVWATGSQVLDAATGRPLGTAPIRMPGSPSDKSGGFVWQGARLYVGEDQWGAMANGGGRYERTLWRWYEVPPVGSGAPWKEAFLEAKYRVLGQSISVSNDGRVAFVNYHPGTGGELFVDGQSVGSSEVNPGLRVTGGRDGVTIETSDGKQRLWAGPVLPDYETVKPWLGQLAR